MNESERLTYLVDRLEGGSAIRFATKVGIDPASLSRARNGKGRPSAYFARIIAAYPDVRRDWLYTGAGLPLAGDEEKGEIVRRLESLEKEVRRLSALLESSINSSMTGAESSHDNGEDTHHRTKKKR